MFKEKRKENVPALAKATAQSPAPLETIVFRGPYNGRSSRYGFTSLASQRRGEASGTVNAVVPVSFHGSRQKGEIQPFFVDGRRFEDSVSRGQSSKQVKCRTGQGNR